MVCVDHRKQIPRRRKIQSSALQLRNALERPGHIFPLALTLETDLETPCLDRGSKDVRTNYRSSRLAGYYNRSRPTQSSSKVTQRKALASAGPSPDQLYSQNLAFQTPLGCAAIRLHSILDLCRTAAYLQLAYPGSGLPTSRLSFMEPRQRHGEKW